MDEPQNEPGEQPDDAEAQALSERAFEALEDGDVDGAQILALQLQEIGWSAYFEVQALLFLQLDLPESAIYVLRRGVEVAPAVWSLWQLLGNTLSDAEEFAEALHCYDRALALEGADEASLRFNRSIVLGRLERFEEELEELSALLARRETIENTALYWRIEAARLTSLVEMGRCAEVVRHAQEMRLLLEMTEDENIEALSTAWSQSASALFDCGEKSRARDWAQEAFALNPLNLEAIDLLRRTREPSIEAEMYFAVTLEGVWNEPDENGAPLGFFTTFLTVARNANEATRLAAELAALRPDEKLEVEGCEAAGRCERQPVGVYEVTPPNTFPLENQDDD